MSWPSNIEQRYVHVYISIISIYFVQMMRVLVRKDILHHSHYSQQNTELVIIASGGHLAENLSSSECTAPKTTYTGSSFWWIQVYRLAKLVTLT
jgi:hypothetical protein